jgi:surface protein
LKELDVSGIDTSNVKNMRRMFYNCSKLSILDVSNFNTSKVTDMSGMFYGCSNLTSLDLSSFDTSNIADISEMFEYATETAPINFHPTNIKVEYSEKYHQVRFTWDKVTYAERYGIAVYLAGKWRIQATNITDTVYTSLKNLTPGKTYKVAIAARVYGKWDTENAIKTAVTVTIK